MRKTQEVLRLRSAGLSIRQIARSCSVSVGAASEYVRRAAEAGLGWPLPEGMNDQELWEKLFPPRPKEGASQSRPEPDMARIHRELRRKGVTLRLLWQEYLESNPDGYRYSRFCELYRRWKKTTDLCLRQEYRAGQKMFVDFAGPTVPIYDSDSGESWPAHIFVAVLGASSYTFAEATGSEALPAWISAHVHAFEYFGGVAEMTIPDCTKTAVSRPCRYEPDLNPTYHELAQHYGTAVIPARPRRPRDKAKVEVAVQVVERWILAVLRHRKFFSLVELNQAIGELLVRLNQRRFRRLGVSRAELFESLDRPALKPLPAQAYELAQWKKATVNLDYHVEYDECFYSVHYSLTGTRVEVRATSTTVEVLADGKRVASHQRSFRKGTFTTLPEHRPKSHQRHLQWTPGRLIQWAETFGVHCGRVAKQIMAGRPHPEQGFRSCLGLMRLGRAYGPDRLEAACQRALALDVCSYRSIASILKSKLDGEVLPGQQAAGTARNASSHVRGARYYR